MKNQERVLVFSALILLAGVILYNVFTSPSKQESGVLPFETEVSSTTVAVSTTKAVSISKAEQSETVMADKKVNINTADESELKTLKGIGDVKAKAIVAYREEHGNFSSVNELTLVSGIGEKTLAKIIDDICV